MKKKVFVSYDFSDLIFISAAYFKKVGCCSSGRRRARDKKEKGRSGPRGNVISKPIVFDHSEKRKASRTNEKEYIGWHE